MSRTKKTELKKTSILLVVPVLRKEKNGFIEYTDTGRSALR